MLNQILLFLISLVCGIAVSGGFIAFIILIGIITELAGKTHTGDKILLYEDMIILGVTTGNIVLLYHLSLPFSQVGMAVFGVFAGIFTGCLAGALAEVVDIFPILSRRLNIHKGLPYLITAMALGKGFGTFVQWFILKN